MKSIFLLFFSLLILTACKKKFFDGPDFYEDNFESYTNLDELLLEDDILWSFTQQTFSENTITVDTSFSFFGQKSLHFEALKSTSEQLSKCSIAKQNLAFWEGETVRVRANYFISGNENLDWLFLMDMEERAAISAGPGIRLALVDNALRMEHKYFEKDITQNDDNVVYFPRDQWVELIWEVKLSQKDKGHVKLWQDGQLILEKNDHRTLPRDFLYSQQGTKGMYNSIEIGATANSYDNDVEIWVDNFKIEKIN